MDVDFDDTAGLGLRRYVHLVTEALGMTGECSYVDVERPLEAYIALEGRLTGFPDWDLALLWNEDRGWAVAVEADSGEDLLVLAHKGGDLVPPPQAVADWTRAFLRDGHGGGSTPAVPAVSVVEDPTRRLTSYATAGYQWALSA